MEGFTHGYAGALGGCPHRLCQNQNQSPHLFLSGASPTSSLSVWDSRPSLFFLTLTTCFKSNLSPKPLTHLEISKSPHNLFRRPGGWAAYNFLDSHRPSPQSTELFSAEQLLVFSRLWICSSQQMVFHGHSPQKAVWTSHAETKCGQHGRFAWNEIQHTKVWLPPTPVPSAGLHRSATHLKMGKALKPYPFAFPPSSCHFPLKKEHKKPSFFLPMRTVWKWLTQIAS